MGIIQRLRDGIEEIHIGCTAVTVDRQSNIAFVVVVLTKVSRQFITVLRRRPFGCGIGLSVFLSGCGRIAR